MTFYRLYSFGLGIVFAVVGLTFLLIPNTVLTFFNDFSSGLGFPEAPLHGMNFYLILAVAYMYLVTLLAFQMCRKPRERIYPFLLTNAKIASSLLSLFLLISQEHYFIFLANFLVDGLIGLSVLILMKRNQRLFRRSH